MNVQIRRK